MREKILITFLLMGLLFIFPKGAIAYNAPDFHASSIVATMSGSDNVPADGITNAVMTVTVIDAYGTPLAGENVSVVVTNDTSAVVSPVSTGLDSSGKAIFYIKSTKQGVDSLDIVDLTQNVTLSGIGHVTFYNPSCNDASPTSSPKLLTAETISNTRIKLTWTKAGNPVTFYTVYYGLEKGKYIYGNPNVGGANTTTYTVGSLNTGTTYYFIVIPGNGCTLGPISNELSAKVILSTSIPIPTEKPTIKPSPTPTTIIYDNQEKITPIPTLKGEDTINSNLNTLSTPIKVAIIISAMGLILISVGLIIISRRR
ncbi:MAG: hypothetical protein A2V72_02710 [Candidatus Nealsonbacteria bacterium RBG_13_37_56]|uniref:Fibronectin type-III domain-containing protein n=1 Tax=Candidatus Nealsonbacteria bacterium RBG_13_37_56 TaxID=1801661 RepID=A0A1G2DXE4_9BACT|nr:MAG: hypothetical protein A2V72_02710 [Candidatus Nealsonbacteria bacterium RBG_13_37_56]HJX46011.1 fibronectin type III domain-containing protein [Patescibacteria group bacterium]